MKYKLEFALRKTTEIETPAKSFQDEIDLNDIIEQGIEKLRNEGLLVRNMFDRIECIFVKDDNDKIIFYA